MRLHTISTSLFVKLTDSGSKTLQSLKIYNLGEKLDTKSSMPECFEYCLQKDEKIVQIKFEITSFKCNLCNAN